MPTFTNDEKTINWRNIGVRRERKFESLMKALVTGDKVIFKHLKDIMVFAAMIGYSEGKREPLNASDTIPITLGTYQSDNQDCFIYLLALMTFQSGEYLRDEKLNESVKVFEEYCNAGLNIIEGWREDNPTIDIVDLILGKIYDQFSENQSDTPIDNTSLDLPPL